MKLVFGSSPLRGNIGKNVEFAEKCARYIIRAGCSPCLPHLFFPRFLDDADPAERDTGISCGLKWLEKSDEAWFFANGVNGCSAGMKIELDYARRHGIPVKFVDPASVL